MTEPTEREKALEYAKAWQLKCIGAHGVCGPRCLVSRQLLTEAARVDELERECERERLRLAACGVAAMCNTKETMEKQRIGRDNPYWSGSYGDVCSAVDREMKLREILVEFEKKVDECKKLHSYAKCPECHTTVLRNAGQELVEDCYKHCAKKQAKLMAVVDAAKYYNENGCANCDASGRWKCQTCKALAALRGEG